MERRIVIAIALSVIAWAMAIFARTEADAAMAPRLLLESQNCTLVDQLADGSDIVRSQRGIEFKFLNNGAVIKKVKVLTNKQAHASSLSEILALTQKF